MALPKNILLSGTSLPAITCYSISALQPRKLHPPERVFLLEHCHEREKERQGNKEKATSEPEGKEGGQEGEAGQQKLTYRFPDHAGARDGSSGMAREYDYPLRP